MNRAVLNGVVSIGALLVLAEGCAKKPPPPPPPPPAMCAKVALGSDVIIGEVLCDNKDTDADLIDDAVDLCPNQQETYNDLEDRDGCADPDQDRDHIPDFDDACPKEVGTPPDGCPDKDSDGDGLADRLDACPYKAEDIDGDHDADGCPEGQKKLVTKAQKDQLFVRGNAVFRRGRSRLTRQGSDTVGQLVDSIYADPSEVARVKLVAVPGRAERRRTKRLNRKRGRNVAKAFEAAGISTERIEIEQRAADGAAEGRVDVQVYLTREASLARQAKKRATMHRKATSVAPELVDGGSLMQGTPDGGVAAAESSSPSPTAGQASGDVGASRTLGSGKRTNEVAGEKITSGRSSTDAGI